MAGDGLPDVVRTSTDIYFNQDVTGGFPKYTTVSEIAAQTQSLAEELIRTVGGQVSIDQYLIPTGN